MVIQFWTKTNTIHTLSCRIITSKYWWIMKWKKCKLNSLKNIIRFNSNFKMLVRCCQVMVEELMQIWFKLPNLEWTRTSIVKLKERTVPKNIKLTKRALFNTLIRIKWQLSKQALIWQWCFKLMTRIQRWCKMMNRRSNWVKLWSI
jgi:hypothetical protein